ncbi:hypothetical protein EVAR_83310_1 [Eumeta japonica]|uniref:Uncharacterized protein n=1 Tax=Eumeta variegata TaxID=151549 RepID=A0A4C1VVL1_EUMVA|nr:hypothetical protein EVAR_83310_1 [Eumeta japonica]
MSHTTDIPVPKAPVTLAEILSPDEEGAVPVTARFQSLKIIVNSNVALNAQATKQEAAGTCAAVTAGALAALTAAVASRSALVAHVLSPALVSERRPPGPCHGSFWCARAEIVVHHRLSLVAQPSLTVCIPPRHPPVWPAHVLSICG